MKLAADDRILNGWYGREFSSPFPSQDAELDGKFKALREGQEKLGNQIAVIEQGKAFSAALGICNSAKAVHVGDLLTDWLPKTAWLGKGATGALDLAQGLFATVPWDGSFDPEKLMRNMQAAGLTIALTTLAAIPVYGQIAAALVGVALKLLDLYTQKGTNKAKQVFLPWQAYSKNTDEDIVKILQNGLFRDTDWNQLFMPPFELYPWFLGNVEGKGSVFMPTTPGGEPGFASGFGCMPGTMKLAGQVQLVRATGPQDALVRRMLDPSGKNSTVIPWRAATIICGDYYPATAQLGAAVWQQSLAAGNPDMYKLDPFLLSRSWKQYFENFFDSAASLMRPKSYDPFQRENDAAISQAVEAYLCWHLKGARGWTIGVPEGHRVGPFWHERFLEDGPVRVDERTSCLFVETDVRDGRKKLWPYTFSAKRLPAQHPELRAQLLKYRGPIQAAGRAPKGYRCVPYPTPELATAAYTNPEAAFIGPACSALYERQLACLRATLVCAYVRPDGYQDLPAYGAFTSADGAVMRQRCLDSRKQLLEHEARFQVNLKDVDAIDPKFADALRAAGVTNGFGQKQAAQQKKANGLGAGLGGGSIPDAPPTGGGVPFAGELAPRPTSGGNGGSGGLMLAALAGLGLAGAGAAIALSGNSKRRSGARKLIA